MCSLSLAGEGEIKFLANDDAAKKVFKAAKARMSHDNEEGKNHTEVLLAKICAVLAPIDG